MALLNVSNWYATRCPNFINISPIGNSKRLSLKGQHKSWLTLSITYTCFLQMLYVALKSTWKLLWCCPTKLVWEALQYERSLAQIWKVMIKPKKLQSFVMLVEVVSIENDLYFLDLHVLQSHQVSIPGPIYQIFFMAKEHWPRLVYNLCWCRV